MLQVICGEALLDVYQGDATRTGMLEVLREDFVRTARAKGASTLRVIGVHALRNALIPVATTIGLQVGTLLAGAILTETIFSDRKSVV